MIKPIGSRVILKAIEVVRKSASGLILPNDNSQKMITGEILACGERVNEVKVGDFVLFNKYSGTKIEFNDQTIILIEESDIIAKLTDGVDDELQPSTYNS